MGLELPAAHPTNPNLTSPEVSPLLSSLEIGLVQTHKGGDKTPGIRRTARYAWVRMHEIGKKRKSFTALVGFCRVQQLQIRTAHPRSFEIWASPGPVTCKKVAKLAFKVTRIRKSNAAQIYEKKNGSSKFKKVIIVFLPPCPDMMYQRGSNHRFHVYVKFRFSATCACKIFRRCDFSVYFFLS